MGALVNVRIASSVFGASCTSSVSTIKDTVGAEKDSDPATGGIRVCRVETRRTVQRIEIRRKFFRDQHFDFVPGGLVTLRKLVGSFSRWDNRDGIPRYLSPRAGEESRDHPHHEDRPFHSASILPDLKKPGG